MSDQITVKVTARVRVIGKIKKHEMVPPTQVQFRYIDDKAKFEGLRRTECNALLTGISTTKAAEHYLNQIIAEIRKGGMVKKQIGGTAFEIDVMDISRSVEDDALGLDAPRHAKIKQAIRRCTGGYFNRCKSNIPDGGINMSGFCHKCYFEGIEAMYDEYKQLRTKGVPTKDAAIQCGLAEKLPLPAKYRKNNS